MAQIFSTAAHLRSGGGQMRRHLLLAALLLLLAGTEAGLLLRAHALRREGAAARADAGGAAAALGLTDLALWTEARYTRHPALADRFTPFQDHPGAIEHFPAGSILPPPPHLRGDPSDAGARP